uniref:Uncharacterized protein n=1 Tax=Arundo donax TaxID=35708 RepID=A0A0A9B0W6_ARUDO
MLQETSKSVTDLLVIWYWT